MTGHDPPTRGARQVVAIYLRSHEAAAAIDRLVEEGIPASGMAIVRRRAQSASSVLYLPMIRLVVLGAAAAGAVIGAVSGVLVQVWELDAPPELPIPGAVGIVFGAAAAALMALLCCAVAALPRTPVDAEAADRYYEVRVGAAFVDRAVRILHGGVTASDDPAATT